MQERPESMTLLDEKILPFQKVGIQFMEQKKRCILGDAMGGLKQLPVDTKILTPDGWTEIGNIAVGDYAIGSDGKPVQVIGVYPQGVQAVYRMTFSDGSSLESGLEHLWTVQHKYIDRKDGLYKLSSMVLTTKEILERPKIEFFKGHTLDLAKTRLQIPMLSSPVQFSPQEDPLPIDPYVLGQLLGNGSLHRSSILMSSHSDDVEYIRSIFVNSGLDCADTKCYAGLASHFGVRGLAPAITDLSLRCKGGCKFIPDVYKYASADSRIAVLRGLMDSDGSISPTRTKVRFCTTSKQLCLDLVEIVEGLGGIASYAIEKQDARSHAKSDLYNVRIRMPLSINPFLLPRKADRWQPGTHAHPMRFITTVEYVRDVESVCIKVDAEDCLYATEHCILTHNTTQALGLCNAVNAKKVLIVCPKTVKAVWDKQTKEWIGEEVVLVAGDYEKRKALIEGDQRFTVIQYDLVGSKKTYKDVAGVKVIDSVNSQHMLDLAAQKYDVIICDEAHRMRNPRSSQALGMKTIVNHSKPEYLLFLTGTPIVNGGQDVFTALSMIDPKKFSSYWNFVKKHFKLGNRYSPWAIGEMLDPESFRQVLAPYMLRRSKEELNKELPPVTYVTIDVDLDPEQQKYYDQMKKKRSITYKGQTIVASSAMVCLGRLKQIAAGLETLEENSDTPLTGSKVDAIIDILEGAGEQKTLIFSQYARAIKGLYLHCVKLFGKDGVAMFTGADSSKKRLEQEEKLKTPKCKVMLMTFGVGSEGGTYTDASIVVCPDLWWTPATNDQAIARVVRKGQTRPVTVYHINTRCTAEDTVTKKLTGKRGLFDSTITKSEVSLLLKEFAKEELGLEEEIEIP